MQVSDDQEEEEAQAADDQEEAQAADDQEEAQAADDQEEVQASDDQEEEDLLAASSAISNQSGGSRCGKRRNKHTTRP